MIGAYHLNQVYNGHCLELLKQLPDNSIHSCITSPPYFGLRSYGTDPVSWPAVTFSPMAGLPEITIPEQVASLGNEADLWAYVSHLVAIFREVKRALRNDGVLWLNLGDSFQSNDSKQVSPGGIVGQPGMRKGTPTRPPRSIGLKPKDLIGIPWRVALALQADGYYLRSDIIWSKKNPMPESVTDRPTKAHEYIFLLAKSERYYFDSEAIREPLAEESWGRMERKQNLIDRTGTGTLGKQIENGTEPTHGYAGLAVARNGKTGYNPAGRNRRSVWEENEPIAKLRDDLTEDQKSYVVSELLRRGLL